MVVCEIESLNEFIDFLEKYDYIICCCYAEMCSNSHYLLPEYESLSDKYSTENIAFVKVDNARNIVTDIKTTPSILFFKKKELKKVIAEPNVVIITNYLTEYLDTSKSVKKNRVTKNPYSKKKNN
jgi:hypothetical protein